MGTCRGVKIAILIDKSLFHFLLTHFRKLTRALKLCSELVHEEANVDASVVLS